MGLHVVTGSANTGKTGALHRAVRNAVHDGGTAALLLPGAPDVRRARLEFAVDSPLGVSVQSFDSYLDSLWLRLYDGRSIIDRAQRVLLVEKAAATCGLDLLARSASRPGFARLAEKMVVRASENGALKSVSGLGHGAADELMALVGAYAGILSAEGLIERADAHRLVIERIRDIEIPAVIAANRFGTLTPQQERFLCAAAPLSDVWVGLTWVDGSPATQAVTGLVRRMAEYGSIEPAGPMERPADASDELIALESRLFTSTIEAADAVAPTGAVVLSEAWGREAEAARIAREVQDAIATGVPAGDIAVVFRDPARHVSAVRKALREVDVAAEYDVRLPLASAGLARALGLLLAFFCRGGNRRDILGFLRTPYVPAAHDRLDEIDRQIRSDRLEGIKVLLARVKRIDPAAARMLELAERLCDQAVTPESIRDWWRLANGMMAAAHGVAPALDESGALDAAAARVIFDALTEMARMEATGFTGRDVLTFLGDAQIALSSRELRDHVQVLGAERMRGRRFSHVILGGLTADEFPQLPSEDALTAPAISSVLSEHGIDVTSRVDLDAERLLFYQVVTRARHRLVLSRRVSDEDGRPVRSSPFLEELLDLYRDPTAESQAWYTRPLPIRTVTLDDLTTGPDVPRSVRRELRRSLLDGDGSQGAPESPRLLHARWRTRGRPACLSEEIAADLAARTVYSVSDIELYNACPYRWYVARVLRPESLDTELDPAAMGRAAHEILRLFYERFRLETGADRVSPATLDAALDIHATVVTEVLATTRVVGLAEEAATRRLARSTRRVVQEDATFLEGLSPAAHEWSFGFGDDPPEQFTGFALRGRIDRIDVGATGFAIIDYKTGSVEGRQAARFADEGLVQLPLYAEVVRRRLGAGEPVAGLYRSILNSGKPRGFFRQGGLEAGGLTRTDGFTEEGIVALIAEAEARAARAVEGMKAGRIEQKPDPKRCPAYCPARVYCEGRR